MTKRELIETLSGIEKAFGQEEAQFQEFFEIAPEGIIILDSESLAFAKYNLNALKILKFTHEELMSKTPESISPEFQPDGQRSDEKVKELIVKALRGEKLVFEWLTINGEGKEFIAEVRLVALTSFNKPQIYASFVDITERKKLEKKIELQNKNLREIAFLQSHQVRQPVANILGLMNLFNFKELNAPLNVEVLLKLQIATMEFDNLIREISLKTKQIERDFD